MHTLREIVDYLPWVRVRVPVRVWAWVSVGAVAAMGRSYRSSRRCRIKATSVGAAHGRDHNPGRDQNPVRDHNLEPLLLSIVAEKTGYPVDMLNLDMDLEGDLGVDSIKRVEILAAVDERAPQLPKVDRARLSALHTLREIVDYLVGTGVGGGVGAGGRGHGPLLHSPEPALPASVAATPSNAPTGTLSLRHPGIGRYALELISAPATGFAMPGLLSGPPLYVIGDDHIAPLLVTTLRRRGVDAHAVTTVPADALACVDLRGLRDVADADTAIAVNREVFTIARQLAARLQSGAGLLVTVQDSGGSFGLNATRPHREWLSGLPALIKTCALEWPLASVKAIDLERDGRSDQAIATAIADELLGGGGEIEVALPADGSRKTLRSVARSVVANAPVLGVGDVVLVSGGARGVTAACLLALAARRRVRFVLLGRTPLAVEPAACLGINDEAGLKRALFAQALATGETLAPSELLARVQQVLAQREIRATLEGLTAAGCKARYRTVAIEDRAALDSALAEVRAEWGPIAGVVHAAGVLADKRIVDKTDAQFDRVFDTKVQGLRALLAATANDPLKLLCVFSSVSARCGNTGQADYAMANEVLAKVAQAEARRRPNLRVKSFGWGTVGWGHGHTRSGRALRRARCADDSACRRCPDVCRRNR